MKFVGVFILVLLLMLVVGEVAAQDDPPYPYYLQEFARSRGGWMAYPCWLDLVEKPGYYICVDDRWRENTYFSPHPALGGVYWLPSGWLVFPCLSTDLEYPGDRLCTWEVTTPEVVFSRFNYTPLLEPFDDR